MYNFKHIAKSSFLLEEAVNQIRPNGEEFIVAINDMIDICSELGNLSIIYRGFKSGKSGSGLKHVVSDRDQGKFRGAIDYRSGSKSLVADVVSVLDIENPVFVMQNKQNVKFFGSAYVFIPIKPFDYYQNKEVYDLNHLSKSDVKLQDIIDGYEKNVKNVNEKNEIIFDIKEYYLLAIENWLYRWIPKKWQVEIENYNQLKELLKKVRWLINKKRENEVT